MGAAEGAIAAPQSRARIHCINERYPAGRPAYLLALAVAFGATLLLVWLSLGVGVIGADDDPDSRMYLRTVAIGALGALGVRFRPRGMALGTLGTALAVAAMGAYAIAAGLGRPSSGPLELALLKGFFVAAFLAAAGLFRRAGSVRSGPDES